MKIALLGYGRMGKSIEGFALEKKYDIVLKINKNNPKELNIINLQKADVAIDFSLPHTAYHNIQMCIDAKVPVVSGTTGWVEQLDAMKKYCIQKNGAFLYASNFSIGVNIFFEINKKLAQLMNLQNQYNIEMEEIHHIHKLDAPSGTAITLAQQIIQNIDRKKEWIEGISKNATLNENSIHIRSKRIEETPGTHSIIYSSLIDSIEIKHTAHSRDGFAQGALLAAEWLQNKKGVYSMKDVLGL